MTNDMIRHAAQAGTLPASWRRHPQGPASLADPARIGAMFRVSPVLAHGESRWSGLMTATIESGWEMWVDIPSVRAALDGQEG